MRAQDARARSPKHRPVWFTPRPGRRGLWKYRGRPRWASGVRGQPELRAMPDGVVYRIDGHGQWRRLGKWAVRA